MRRQRCKQCGRLAEVMVRNADGRLQCLACDTAERCPDEVVADHAVEGRA